MRPVIGIFTIYDDSIVTKQWVRFFGRACLEDSKGVLQLADSITHAGNPTVQVFGSGDDKAFGKGDTSPVSFGILINCMGGEGVERMVPTEFPVLWQDCLVVKGTHFSI